MKFDGGSNIRWIKSQPAREANTGIAVRPYFCIIAYITIFIDFQKQTNLFDSL